MKPLLISTRQRWLIWLATLVAFVAVLLYPVSSVLTRAGGAFLAAVLWFGLIALLWKNRFARPGLIGLTACALIFLLLPSRRERDPASLRAEYVAGLLRYDRVTYYWGGESSIGIDCSGLVRRGLIDSLFLRGLRTLDSALIRQSIWVWWHDYSASDFGRGGGLVSRILDAPSINALDHSQLLPGDLAVVNGVHIMAYTGSRVWIEADPDAGRVITVTAPSKENGSFRSPVRIVRWHLLR